MSRDGSGLHGALLDLDIYASYIEDVTGILRAEDFTERRQELAKEAGNLFLFTMLYLPTFLVHAQKEGLIPDIELVCTKIRNALTEFRTALWCRLEDLGDAPKLLGRLTALAQQEPYAGVIEYQYRAKIAHRLREMRAQAGMDFATLSQEAKLPTERLELLERGISDIPSPDDAWRLDRALLGREESVGPLATLVYEYHSNLERAADIEPAGKTPRIGVIID